MAKSAAGIIFSSLNNNTLSRLTSDRTVAAIPFACRYRLIDFALSNMVNANISNIYIVANYKYRSLLEHLGSGKDWDLARREGGITFISPYQTSNQGKNAMFSTHMEALKSMKEYITEIKEEYVNEYLDQYLAYQNKTKDDIEDWDKFVEERKAELFDFYDDDFFAETTYYEIVLDTLVTYPTISTLDDRRAYPATK